MKGSDGAYAGFRTDVSLARLNEGLPREGQPHNLALLVASATAQPQRRAAP